MCFISHIYHHTCAVVFQENSFRLIVSHGDRFIGAPIRTSLIWSTCSKNLIHTLRISSTLFRLFVGALICTSPICSPWGKNLIGTLRIVSTSLYRVDQYGGETKSQWFTCERGWSIRRTGTVHRLHGYKAGMREAGRLGIYGTTQFFAEREHLIHKYEREPVELCSESKLLQQALRHVVQKLSQSITAGQGIWCMSYF